MPLSNEYDVSVIRGGARLICSCAGLEHVEAVRAAEEQLAARVREMRPIAELLALQTVRSMEGTRLPVLRIDPRDAVVGADPERALRIGLDAVDRVVRQPVLLRQVREPDGLGLAGVA